MVRPGATIGCSWKVCCGSCVRALPGAIFRRRLAIGTACSGASVDGAPRGFGGGSSRRCPMIRTLNISSSIPPSSGRISTPRGRKKGSEDQALGRSRGGLSTKIHMAVRGLGCPVRFTLTAGQKGDAPQAAALIEGLPAEVVMADTAYVADPLRQAIAAKGAIAVIPNNPSRALKYPLDKHLYAQRHLVECCFSKLKQFRRVATRFEKTARNYHAVVTLAATILWLR